MLTKSTCAGLSHMARAASTSRYLRFRAEHANTVSLSLRRQWPRKSCRHCASARSHPFASGVLPGLACG